jgi:ankyrin repeat protein
MVEIPEKTLKKKINDFLGFLNLCLVGNSYMVGHQLANGMTRYVNTPDDDGDVALHKACRSRGNSLGVARLLIEAGAKVDIRNKKGRAPLHYAVAIGDYALVKFLLRHKANVNIAEREEGCTPIFFAVKRRYKNIIKLLIRSGADQNIKNFKGEVPSDCIPVGAKK